MMDAIFFLLHNLRVTKLPTLYGPLKRPPGPQAHAMEDLS